MELEAILNLVKAGFTKDEILQMAQPKPNPADPVPADDPAPDPAPAPEPSPVPAQPVPPVAVPQPAPQPAQVEVQNPAAPTLEDIMKGIAHLTSAVQANAIANSVIPQGLTQPVKPEDIMAEIIRPSYKERKD